MVLSLTMDQEPKFDEIVREYSDGMAEFLSDAAKGTQKINRVPRAGYKKERFLSAMQEAFEIIGGVPRLALWADKNQDEFYKLCGKTIPGLLQQHNISVNVPVKIVSAIAPSALDGDTTSVIEHEPQEPLRPLLQHDGEEVL